MMVRCNECSAVHRGSYKRSKCWTKWKLCRVCAVKLHADEYTVPYVAKVISKQSRLKNT